MQLDQIHIYLPISKFLIVSLWSSLSFIIHVTIEVCQEDAVAVVMVFRKWVGHKAASIYYLKEKTKEIRADFQNSGQEIKRFIKK